MPVITLIRGDGIGPEVVDAAVLVLDALRAGLEWDVVPAGFSASAGELLPAAVRQSFERTGLCLKGPLATPIGTGHASLNVALRKHFELYANLRPISNLPGVESRFSGVDLIIVRENTEGLYSGIEHEIIPGVVESLKIATEKACTRIAEFAFRHAREQKRRQIASVHKANIMKLTDGLFLRCARAVAEKYPELDYREIIVDNACMQLVLNPAQFDVLLLENLYGDIVSDLCAGLVGGLGLVAGANLGETHALFEAVHGTAPDLAGQDQANPTAVLLAGEMLLRHIGQFAAADRLHAALLEVYREGKVLTRDAGGQSGTRAFAQAVLEKL